MWLSSLVFGGTGTANAVMVIATVSMIGLAVGSIRLGPVQLGIAGPLFVGIALGSLGFKMDADILGFARDFGLILFVYAIGNRVGPGFFSAFKKDGALLNALSVAIVVLGTLTAVAIHYAAGLPLEIISGLLAGGTTNTPSLAAAQQTLATLHATPVQIADSGLAYATAYPFGIVGILLAMGLLRMAFRADVPTEATRFAAAQSADRPPVEQMSITIHSQAIEGMALPLVPGLGHVAMGIIVSRLTHDGVQHVALPTDILHVGDVLLCDGPRLQLDILRDRLGSGAAPDAADNRLAAREMLVTRPTVVGKHITDLHIRDLYGVTMTRLNRSGIDLVPAPGVKLRFGDHVSFVGETSELAQVATLIGNQAGATNPTQIIPIFLGIALGVLLGSIPVYIPGIAVPLALGLAGGPVVVAIVLSRIGSIGPLRWSMTPDANDTVRDLGVCLFMSCVGIYAGKSFVATILSGDGLLWMGYAALITFVPLIVVGAVARGVFKINYLTLCGLLAGSATDPPGLAFANAMNPSQAQSMGYAAVYPLTMCLRILAPQIILGLLWLPH
jgi:putative transport protein